MTDQQDKLLAHEYDGIKELDNDLPKWWIWLFYITIVWGVLYFAYYHVFGIGYLQHDEYMSEMNANYIRVSQNEGKFMGILPEYHSPFFIPGGDKTPRQILLAGPQVEYVEESRDDDTTIYVALTDESSLTAGQSLFMTHCFSCHGKQGEGGVGPNLTDNYWLHGAEMTDVTKSIKFGFASKGMIAWRGFLKPEQIMNVSSYVMTMKGSNVSGGKAPQGDLIEE